MKVYLLAKFDGYSNDSEATYYKVLGIYSAEKAAEAQKEQRRLTLETEEEWVWYKVIPMSVIQ